MWYDWLCNHFMFETPVFIKKWTVSELGTILEQMKDRQRLFLLLCLRPTPTPALKWKHPLLALMVHDFISLHCGIYKVLIDLGFCWYFCSAGFSLLLQKVPLQLIAQVFLLFLMLYGNDSTVKPGSKTSWIIFKLFLVFHVNR